MLNNKNNKLFFCCFTEFSGFHCVKGVSHYTPTDSWEKTNYLFSNTALKPNKGMHGFSEDYIKNYFQSLSLKGCNIYLT